MKLRTWVFLWLNMPWFRTYLRLRRHYERKFKE